MKPSGWVFVITVMSLSLLWSMSAYSFAEGVGPGTICVVQVMANGETLAIFVNDRTGFDIAVLVPRDNVANVPVRCEDLMDLAAGMTNQEAFPVSLKLRVYTNNGGLICNRPRNSANSFTLGVNEARGGSP